VRVLLDENLPRALKQDLVGHEVSRVAEIGWSGVSNGELLGRAGQFFDALVTADRNLEFQQNVAAATVGIVVVVVHDTRVQTIRPLVPEILAALEMVEAGSVVRVGEH
jgi:hypothetical protein